MTGGKKHKAKALTYSSYLRLDALLALQTPESAEHDELHQQPGGRRERGDQRPAHAHRRLPPQAHRGRHAQDCR